MLLQSKIVIIYVPFVSVLTAYMSLSPIGLLVAPLPHRPQLRSRPECGLSALMLERKPAAKAATTSSCRRSKISGGTEDVPQCVEADSTDGRTAQQDMPREVRLLVAHRAAGRWAYAVVAARAGV